MEASGSPPKYRFIFYSLDLLAQYDKPYPNELWKISTSEDQTERKKRQIRGSETQKWLENETSRPIKNASEMSRSGQNFPRPKFFEVAFCSPTYWFLN